ncbi:hypothetical protein HKD37_03G006985 [Glycine soja]
MAWHRYQNNIHLRKILSERNVELSPTMYDEFYRELQRRKWHCWLTRLLEKRINVALYLRTHPDHQAIVAKLYTPSIQFILNVDGALWKLLGKDLTTLAHTWSVLSYFNLAPTSYTSNLNMD